MTAFTYHPVIQFYKHVSWSLENVSTFIDILGAKNAPKWWPEIVSGCFTSSHGHLESGQVGHRHQGIAMGCDGVWYLVYICLGHVVDLWLNYTELYSLMMMTTRTTMMMMMMMMLMLDEYQGTRVWFSHIFPASIASMKCWNSKSWNSSRAQHSLVTRDPTFWGIQPFLRYWVPWIIIIIIIIIIIYIYIFGDTKCEYTQFGDNNTLLGGYIPCMILCFQIQGNPPSTCFKVRCRCSHRILDC